jgi:membrane protein involved in colicin uptake
MSEPITTPPSLAEQRAQQYVTAKRNLAIGLFVACPVIALLPPRKLDLYTLALGGVWIASANHVSGYRTGRTIFQRVLDPTKESVPTERYRQMQKQMREAGIQGSDKANKQQGVVEKLWMGDQGDDWKVKRAEKEREVLQSGEGYGTLIMDQIKEVWTGKKTEDEESEGAKTQETKRKS